MVFEKGSGIAKALSKKAPEPFAAHFGASAGEALNRTLGMYAGRGLLDFFDAEPIPDDGNFTKWNGCLKHAKGAGVHSHKKVFFAMRGKTL